MSTSGRIDWASFSVRPVLARKQAEMLRRTAPIRPLLPPPRKRPVSIRQMERSAYSRGLLMGQNDIHYAPQLNYQHGCEWRAWLKGWRRGQEQLAAQRDAERRELEAFA